MSLLAVDLDLEHARYAKLVVPVVLLVLFWLWETWRPLFGRKRAPLGEARWSRLRHAGHNLALALVNTAVLSLAFGTVTVLAANWAERNNYGLLHALSPAAPVQFVLALVVLDAWMYVWHRANHAVPLLWRFHRMHHSDNRMDVTTATRFHLGEHVGANVLRLALIVLVGINVWNIVVYELLVVVMTQFHHADISLGRWDAALRWLLVTPAMHKVHHSRLRPETDSNYSTVFSVWDRLARTFRLHARERTISFGLDEFDAPEWQTFWGMLKTPFVGAARSAFGVRGSRRGANTAPPEPRTPNPESSHTEPRTGPAPCTSRSSFPR